MDPARYFYKVWYAVPKDFETCVLPGTAFCIIINDVVTMSFTFK